MSFPINIYLLGACAGVFVVLGSMPLWRRFCERVMLIDDPGPRKIHTRRVPLAGGLAVLTGIVVPLLLALISVKSGGLGIFGPETTTKLDDGFQQHSAQLAPILFGVMGMTLLGCLDDRFELWPALKFVGQVLIAWLVAAGGVRITLFVPNLAFSYVITILWIVTVINAVNFLDNMNGLCAGLGAVISLLIGLSAARYGQYLVATMAFLVFGATLGFLPFNYPKASAFLGDAGSHLIGFLLAVLSILPDFHSPAYPRPLAVLSPLLFLAVPLGDLIWVVLLRFRLGKPFYIGDNNHLSHRLVRRGFSPAGAVALIWLLTAVLGGLTFLL